MATNSAPAPKHGGSGGGGEIENRMTAVEARLRAIEIVAWRVEIAQITFRAAVWVLAVISIGSAIATTDYSLWLR